MLRAARASVTRRRPARGLPCLSMRAMRPLSEAECYARCYGTWGAEVRVLPHAGHEPDPRLDPLRGRRAASAAARAPHRRARARSGLTRRSTAIMRRWSSTTPFRTRSGRACASSSRDQPRRTGARVRRRRSRTRATTSGGCSTRPASRRASSSRRSTRELLDARDRADERGAAHDARLGRPAQSRLRGRGRAPRGDRRARIARASSPSSARSRTPGAFGGRVELGLQERTLDGTALFVLPSTSPANAAVPWDERLRWFRALRELVDA